MSCIDNYPLLETNDLLLIYRVIYHYHQFTITFHIHTSVVSDVNISVVGACGHVDMVVGKIGRSGVRFSLLVMCRHVGQTSCSILPLPT